MNQTEDHIQDTLESLRLRAEVLRAEWHAPKPFPYVIIDDFLPATFAQQIHAVYPAPDEQGWDTTVYTHQKKKFTRTSGFPSPIDQFFALTATAAFRELISSFTGIPKILDDPDLVGGGLHQTMRGGFLDIHVDFNFHPNNKLHRRMNLLLYMNQDWRPEYEGYLQLWDMASRCQVENVAPIFNRAVLFETSEVSFHGHPRPLNTPPGVTRKSLAIYYYTEERERTTVAPEHNTMYKQTTGLSGYVKTGVSSMEAAVQRLREQGLWALGKTLAKQVGRRVRNLPPENG